MDEENSHQCSTVTVNCEDESPPVVKTTRFSTPYDWSPRKKTLGSVYYRSEFGRYFRNKKWRIDFVLVYKQYSDEVKDNKASEIRRQFYLQNLEILGVKFEPEVKTVKNNVMMNFLKIHIPFDLLCKTADRLKMKKPLVLRDEPVVTSGCELESVAHRIFDCYYCSRKNRVDLESDPKTIFYPFDEKDKEFFDAQDQQWFFTDSERHEIAWHVLQMVRNDPNNGITRGIESLLKRHIFETAYPCHNGYSDDYVTKSKNEPDMDRQILRNHWTSCSSVFKQQPLHLIRQYFGEKISFYFAFLDFYTKQLVIPTIVGIILCIISLTVSLRDPELQAICNEHEVPGNYIMCPICKPPHCAAWRMYKDGCSKYRWEFALDNGAMILLSFIVMLWAVVFLKLWKRQEASLSSDWNVLYKQVHSEGVRAEYEKRANSIIINPVTGKSQLHIKSINRVMWTALSILATIFILCATGACLGALIGSRVALYGAIRQPKGKFHKYNILISRRFIATMIFVVVTVSEKIYFKVGRKLTSFECPRTSKDYMNSLLWKLFIFQMLNNLIPISYAAWIKGKTVATPIHLNSWTEICDGACAVELAELVFALLFFRLVIGNAFEYGLPFLKNCFRKCRIRSSVGRHSTLPQYLNNYYLNEKELDGVYEDYMEMMVQFMFVVCFTTIFPLAPLVCLLNNIIEIRLDATKLLQLSRRPVPVRVPGIQIWNHFLDFIIKLGIFINAALIAFTSDIVPRLYYSYNVASSNLTTLAGNYTSYINYSLSFVYVKDWHDEQFESEFYKKYKTDKCYYPGYREPDPNLQYSHKPEYWKIVIWKITAFTLYVISFFIVRWCVNALISDMPRSTSLKFARQSYRVKNFFNEERRLRRRTDFVTENENKSFDYD